MKSSNKDEFVYKANKRHNGKYTYERANYVNNATKLTITCPIHGDFDQTPNRHLNSNGCLKCGNLSRGKKLTLSGDAFISKAKEVHADLYNYDKVNYKDSRVEVTIVCKKHGEFTQRPRSHLSGNGCPSCWLEKNKLSLEQFITKAKEKHGDKYDYSKVDYVDSNTEVIIACKKHGEFTQRPRYHLEGSGCNKCVMSARKSSTHDIITKAKEKHGDKYDYSKVDYVDSRTKVTIICKKHGEFTQPPFDHIGGAGCSKCYSERRGDSLRLPLDQFISKAERVHDGKYIYSKVEYINTETKVKIVCKKHGVFLQIPNAHLSGQGCPKCRRSKGEETISRILKKHNIKFKEQFKLPYYQFKYDFYLPKFKTLIEFHGIQHYKPIKFMGGKEQLRLIQQRDRFKRNLAFEYRLRLIEIHYNLLNSLSPEEFEDRLIREIHKCVKK